MAAGAGKHSMCAMHTSSSASPHAVRTALAPAIAAIALAMLGGWGAPAFAQDGPAPQDRHRDQARDPHWQLDGRYHHDHYYPPRGYAMRALPQGSLSIGYGGGAYYFHGGVWFRPWGGRFVVTMPPLGVVVPLLPPSYATLWIGGAPYYYANGVYYAQSPGQGYAVVAPPPGAETAQPVPAAKPLPPPIIYPRSGQSTAQIEADRQACDRWATTQPSAMADAQVFQRAVAACMDGRGYTVR